MPTERLMREAEWPRLDWLSAITGAFIFVALVVAGVLVSMVWPSVSIPAPPPATIETQRYDLQVISTMITYQVYLLDSATGQVWLLNREALVWRALPAINSIRSFSPPTEQEKTP